MKRVQQLPVVEVCLTKNEFMMALRDFVNRNRDESIPEIESVPDFRFDSHGDTWVIVQCVPMAEKEKEQVVAQSNE